MPLWEDTWAKTWNWEEAKYSKLQEKSNHQSWDGQEPVLFDDTGKINVS